MHRRSTQRATEDIVVIGAGYAGMTAALRLAPRHRVTLIDEKDSFVERIRLHEFASGRPSVTMPLAELTEGTGITTVTARVTGLDPHARTVRTQDGRSFRYTTLVYALGSTTDVSAPGVAEYAYTVERATELRKRLADGPGTVAVVGGGLTGVELAAELAESYPDWQVRLVTDGEPAAGLSAKGRAHVGKVFRRLGVEVSKGVRATGVGPDGLLTGNGPITADAVVWAASFTVPDLAARAGLAVDHRGRVVVDAVLRSTSHPEVFAVGDAAAVSVPGVGELRMSCATAMPIAAHAASAIDALARGEEPGPFSFRYLVQCVSLGRRDAVIQPVHADDSPHRTALTGRPAAWVKERVCRFTVGSLRSLRRHPDAYWWPKADRAAARAAVAA